jgi:hypothetical protein
VAVNEYVLLKVTLPAVCVNVGTVLRTDVPLCVYAALVTKLTEGVIVPLECAKVPLTVNVVQVIVPKLVNVPETYVAVELHVKLNVAKSIVPAVCVNVVTLNAADNVTVPTPLLTINPAIVFALLVTVPVPAAVIDKLVYVPPAAKVKLPVTFTVDTAGVAVEPVKFKLLNQLPVVIVGIAAPAVIARLSAVVIEPPAVDPHVSVLVTLMAVVKPPVPDQVKLVRSAILNTTVAAVV